jgi:hypothetical protein
MNKYSRLICALGLIFLLDGCSGQNTDPDAAQIYTSDLDNFWKALDLSKPNFEHKIFDEYYISPGSKGIKGFTKGRIQNAQHLAKVVKAHQKYYGSIRNSTDSIAGMALQIKQSFTRLKEFYPEAIFPPVYFVIGALNSGGTTSKDGIVIGCEMYGVSSQTDMSEVNNNKWLQTVLKPVGDIPHIVAHELIHIQQHSSVFSMGRSSSLLEQSIREGSADFLSELISGKHINQHIHDFADPKEKELWNEFKDKMNGKDYDGWLYSPSEDRPNDLGYWIGYKITKSYYSKIDDKKKAIHEILNIKNFNDFLKKSGYAESIE